MEDTWAKLHWDVQLMVLKSLSPQDLLTLQFSSDYFKSLLSDLEFVIQYEKNRPSHTPFYRQTRRTFWQFGDIDHLWTLTAYGDGFLCYQTFLRPSTTERIFLAFNPLSHNDRWILTAPDNDCSGGSLSEIAGIAFDQKNGVPKLVLCQKSIPFDYHSERTTYVYNFKELTWKKIPESREISSKLKVGPPLDCNAQIVNGRLLCWVMDCVQTWCIPYMVYIPYMVLVFDLEEEAWLDPIPVSHELSAPVCIAEHEDEVCLVGGGGSTNGMMELRVWKMDKLLKIFRADEIIPPQPSNSLWKRHDLVGGRGAFLWITRFHIEEEEGDVEIQRVWVYDMSRRSWEDLGTLSLATQYDLVRATL